MDGDKLPDRVIRPLTAPYTHWFWQKNNGKEGFEDALLWEEVDDSFFTDIANPEASVAGSLSWYIRHSWGGGVIADVGDLMDMNGDGRPDRVLLKNEDPANTNPVLAMYVQINNGSGFDAAAKWYVGDVSPATPTNGMVNSSIRLFRDIWGSRHYISDLVDVTGDGFPDRVVQIWDSARSKYVWSVRKGSSTGFPAPDEMWDTIEGVGEVETSIGQDNKHFTSIDTPNDFQRSVDLKDINGDKIADRLIFRAGENKWLVQFGTGSGFLPGMLLLTRR
jgi:hypothetical protein